MFSFAISIYEQAPSVAVSGPMVGAFELGGSKAPCPYEGSVYTFNRPPGGWSSYSASMLQPTVGVEACGVNELAINAAYYVVGGVGSTGVYTASSPAIPPNTADVSITGAASGTPRIALRLNAGANSAPIQSFSLTLPSGLRLRGKQDTLRNGVRITGAGRYVVHLVGRTLVVTLDSPARADHASVLVKRSALLESRSLLNRVLRLIKANRSRRHKKVLTLPAYLRTADTTGSTTAFRVNLRLS